MDFNFGHKFKGRGCEVEGCIFGRGPDNCLRNAWYKVYAPHPLFIFYLIGSEEKLRLTVKYNLQLDTKSDMDNEVAS